MSIQDYVNIVAPEPAWLTELGDASKRRGTDKLTSRQIETIITRARREKREKPVRR